MQEPFTKEVNFSIDFKQTKLQRTWEEVEGLENVSYDRHSTRTHARTQSRTRAL